MEEGATLTEPLIPWTVTGIYMATTLQISTFEYLPYALFNIASIATMFIFAVFYKFKFGTPPAKGVSKETIVSYILQACGGENNVKVVDSYATRVRITIKNTEKINSIYCEQVEVLGYSYYIVGDQLQIVTTNQTTVLYNILKQEI